jgi:hypothetical protein
MMSLMRNRDYLAVGASAVKSRIPNPFLRKSSGPTLRGLLAASALITISLACVSTARAQILRPRVYVSAAAGVNAGGCSLNSPCKTFAYAVTQAVAGGEVIVLDSGGYGPVTITKALTLTAPAGVYASIIADTAGTNAVTVAAGVADTVVLRGLTLTGLGGDNGVLITQAGTVHVENCVISSFDGLGLNGMGIKHVASAKLYVKDTVVRDNPHAGIYVEAPAGGAAQVSVDNVRAENNLFGIYLFARAKGTINRSIASGGAFGIVVNNGNSGDAANASVAAISDCVALLNSTDGFAAYGTGSKAVAQDSTASGSGVVGFRADDGGEMSVQHCVAINNHFGVHAEDAGTVARVSDSTVTNNIYGFNQTTNALFESRGNNTVRSNTTAETSGLITVIPGT